MPAQQGGAPAGARTASGLPGGVAGDSTRHPERAHGGAVDVLAGLLTGLLAQPAWQKDTRRTLRYAVWRHGAAADALATTRPHWGIEELAGAC